MGEGGAAKGAVDRNLSEQQTQSCRWIPVPARGVSSSRKPVTHESARDTNATEETTA